jgi:hypothetical protein
MPTVLRKDGFNFMINTDDHEPKGYLIEKWKEIHGDA